MTKTSLAQFDSHFNKIWAFCFGEAELQEAPLLTLRGMTTFFFNTERFFTTSWMHHY